MPEGDFNVTEQEVPKPLALACERVGMFLYYFSPVEMQLDAAITTISNSPPDTCRSSPSSIGFARKVDIVQRAVAVHNAGPSKKIKMDTFSELLDVNGHRVIIAHSSFEPDGSDAVQFGRGPWWTKLQFEQRCWKLQRLENKACKRSPAK